LMPFPRQNQPDVFGDVFGGTQQAGEIVRPKERERERERKRERGSKAIVEGAVHGGG
jgi:hypothetical protein